MDIKIIITLILITLTIFSFVYFAVSNNNIEAKENIPRVTYTCSGGEKIFASDDGNVYVQRK